MNFLRRIFHLMHKWELIDNPNKNTERRYPTIRFCVKCGKLEIIQLAWAGTVTNREGVKVKVSTPSEWLPMLEEYEKTIKRKIASGEIETFSSIIAEYKKDNLKNPLHLQTPEQPKPLEQPKEQKVTKIEIPLSTQLEEYQSLPKK